MKNLVLSEYKSDMELSNVSYIKKFCETQQTKHLGKLEQPYAVLFQRLSSYALTQPNAKHDIAKKVLQYYNLDDQCNRTNLVDRGRSKVEGYVNSLSMALTGARSGDVLVGTARGTKGAVMRIHHGNVPPQKRHLDAVRYYPDLWSKFIVKLGSVPFFTNMSILTREIWLEMHEADNENSIGEEGARLEITQPGTGIFVEKLSETDLDRLVQGNPDSEDGFWTNEEIENMIPRKAGSKAKKHTLVLFRVFWRIAVDYEISDQYDGLVIDIPNGKVMKGSAPQSGREIFLIDSITKCVVQQPDGKWQRPVGKTGVQRIGMLASTSRANFSNIDQIIQRIYPTDVGPIRSAMKGFTNAAHKSLLQKIIRFRPDKVSVGTKSKLYDARSILLVSMTELARHPGAFVPDIQRYVTGLESFAKRVAVSIYEDSYIPESMFRMLFSMLSGAMLVQRVRTWVPDEETMTAWLRTGIAGWEAKSAYSVDYHGEVLRQPYVLDADQYVLKNASAVLDELRSFPTDLGLARGWARDWPNIEIQSANGMSCGVGPCKISKPDVSFQRVITPEVMPLAHCVDHHWAPQIAHYFVPEYVESVCEERIGQKPFEPLFGRIWNKTSGVNPRRKCIDFRTYESDEDVLQIRLAQTRFLIALQTVPKMRHTTDEVYEFSYTLNDAWIAGLVGAMEVKPTKHPVMLVTLASDDPLRLIVIRRPSRNMVEEQLSDEAQEAGIAIARQKLIAGVSMDKARAPVSDLEGAKLYLVESVDGDYYAVQKKGSRELIPWTEIRNIQIDLPVHPDPGARTIEFALTHIGGGVEENASEELQHLINRTEPKVIRRSLTYLGTYNHTIEMNRISRDGSGTYQAVLIEDVAAYQFMLVLSILYPAALRVAGPSKFDVPIGPVLWTVVEKIKEYFIDEVMDTSGWDEVPFRDTKRQLRSYQQEIVDDMVKSDNKGSFIWANVGMGKTMSVLAYLQYRKENGTLPPYIIYTLPESAIKSIIQEIKYFQVPINLIIPLADVDKRVKKHKEPGVIISQNPEPQPFVINLIEHDHLRRAEEAFSQVASRSIFIVDEVHKTLNDTKRTSVASNLASLSRYFIVLTGTPVIDNNTYKLINWLEQVVPYEVNQKNFYVAASSMIAKKVNTGIKVIREEVVAVMGRDDEDTYRTLVPPALGGTNVKPSHQDWVAATEICYEAASREMIKQVGIFLKQNRGVMLVSKDQKHAEKLRTMLSIDPEDIYVMGPGDSIFFTDEAVQNGQIHDYKVVIVPMRKAEGYTLTRLSAMVTSVYPSNNATREQLDGRINRISQKRPEIDYRVVHVGILTAILRNHDTAKSLSLALQGLAKSV